MRRWWLVIALLLSVGVNLGILATLVSQGRLARRAAPVASPTSWVAEGDVPAYVHRMADELELEGERRTRFVDVHRMFTRTVVHERQRLGRAQQRFRRALTARRPDRTAVEAHLQTMIEAQAALERALVACVLDSRALLEPREERRFMVMMARVRRAQQRDGRSVDGRWRPQRP